MKTLAIAGKYLDQPLLVSKFNKAVPGLLLGGAGLYIMQDLYHKKPEERKKSFIKNLSVLGFTAASALIATRGIKPIKINQNGKVKEIFKGFKGLSDMETPKEIKEKNTKMIDEFLEKNKITSKTREILTKAKESVLSFSEVKHLQEDIGSTKEGSKFLNGEEGLIPDPENIDSKKIFGEIGRLSLMGLVPVVGGVTGGVIGDKLTEKNWKERVPNKIKEGSYQYLANIFLCNVGAGGALAIMEKMNVKSKAARAVGMVAGIVATGIVGGSAIANYISKKCIDPLLNDKKCNKEGKGLYSERTPEAIDVGLHLVDLATVAVMSGLSWIEPALPMLYSISGFRAGIGYRNGHGHHHSRQRGENKKLEATA
ncbi:MAG: hypothetical protein PHE78_02645 [Candidatus Gastranaerophilales bacterium]|nr:hypothetical protein [Candidatus Gastranaerophilales bacterium]